MKAVLFASVLLAIPESTRPGEEARGTGAGRVLPPAPEVSVASEAGWVRLTSGRLELTVGTASHLDPCALRDRSSRTVFADSGYVWPAGGRPPLAAEPRVTREAAGRVSVTFEARLDDLAIQQKFEARPESPDAIVETIVIRNAGSRVLESSDFRCGFAKVLARAGDWTRDADAVRFCGVPYRRDTDGLVREFPVRRVAEQRGSFTGWMEPVHETPSWGSEGWVWSAGRSSLLVAKHNPDSMEWSLLSPVTRATPSGAQETVICFGGAGLWKHGSPEGDEVTLRVSVPARGHSLVRLKVAE